MKIISYLPFLFLFSCSSATTPDRTSNFSLQPVIDSLIMTSDFSGIVLIQKNGKTVYSLTQGMSDREAKTTLTLSDQFVIGSISKQITAVLVMKAMEKGKIDLNQTIDHYLPDLHQTWGKDVTVHQLLTHTHGIVSEEAPLAFIPGSKFSYSQLGYHLLARILEKVEHTSFQELSTDFFQKHGLNNTFHPENNAYNRLVDGYESHQDGTVSRASNSLANYAEAGSFISTAADLSKWNHLLHDKKLVKKETYERMQQEYASRNHPLCDSIRYGYGLLFQKGKNEEEIGTFGYVPGFASTSFFYPKSKISLVILSNFANDPNNLHKVFFIHTELMQLMRTVH